MTRASSEVSTGEKTSSDKQRAALPVTARGGQPAVRVDAWAFRRETLFVVWSEGRIVYVSPLDDRTLNVILKESA